jgi:hypothetical protein
MRVTNTVIFLLAMIFQMFLLVNFLDGQNESSQTIKGTIKSLVKGKKRSNEISNPLPEIEGMVKYEEVFADTVPPAGWFTVNQDSSPVPDTSWGYYEEIVFSWGDTVRPQAGNFFWANSYQNAKGSEIDDWLITPRLPVLETGDSLYVWVNAIGMSTIIIYPNTVTVWLSRTDSLLSNFVFSVDTIVDPGPAGEWHRYAMDITVNDQMVGYAPFVGFKHDHRNGGPFGPGSNWVHLDHVVLANGGYVTTIQNKYTATPTDFILEQNYPNPFNPTTTIAYQLNNGTDVLLAIYNLAGQQIRTLVNERQSAGTWKVVWDGKDLHGNMVASGIYLYRLNIENNIQTRKMILIK